MSMHLFSDRSPDFAEILRLERLAFAAKLRMARAVIGWSQSELAERVGLTQRAIHKLEQGGTEPRRATVHAIDEIWREEGIAFEDLADGGFTITVRNPVLERTSLAPARQNGQIRRAS